MRWSIPCTGWFVTGGRAPAAGYLVGARERRSVLYTVSSSASVLQQVLVSSSDLLVGKCCSPMCLAAQGGLFNTEGELDVIWHSCVFQVSKFGAGQDNFLNTGAGPFRLSFNENGDLTFPASPAHESAGLPTAVLTSRAKRVGMTVRISYRASRVQASAPEHEECCLLVPPQLGSLR